MNQMRSRLISTAVGLPLALFLIILGGNIFNVFVLLISLIALQEFYNAINQKHKIYKPLTYIGYFSIVILFLILTNDISLISLYFFFLVFVYLIILLFNTNFTIEDVSISLFGVLYVGMTFGSVILLRQSNYGKILTFYLLILSWGTDTFAFFIGKFLGKHKLMPRVSPNKTIEGAIGGLIVSALLSTIYIYFVGQKIKLIPNVLILFIVGILGSMFSQLGDLVASDIKRSCDIKDFGKIIPGHGGILDRFDGLIFVSSYLFILLFIYNRFLYL